VPRQKEPALHHQASRTEGRTKACPETLGNVPICVQKAIQRSDWWGGHGKRLIVRVNLEPKGAQTMGTKEHKKKTSRVETLVAGNWPQC
jgi:hypothetical protein